MGQGIEVSLASNPSDMEKVYRLTYKAFLKANLIAERADEKVVHHPNLDALDETYVIVAKSGDDVIGTITVTLDSEAGLHTDCPSFKTKTDEIRKESRKLASSWRIAIDPEHNATIAVLNMLLNKVAYIVHDEKIETILYTFSPTHARIYERMLNLEAVAHGEDDNPDIHNDQKHVVMMRGYTEKLPEKFKFV